jgi:hypothetical protein
MGLPKPFQNFWSGNFVWIEDNLNNFDMSGGLRVNFLRAWVWNMASHESRGSRYDSVKLLENGLYAPVAAPAKSNCFVLFRISRFVGFDVHNLGLA